MNTDLMEDLDKLTDTIINVIEANKHKVINKYPTSRKGIRVECKDFFLEAYTYAFLKTATIWLFINPSKIDKYNHLIEQFNLIGFEVYTVDKKTSEERGIPFVREIRSEFKYMSNRYV